MIRDVQGMQFKQGDATHTGTMNVTVNIL